MGKIWRVSGPVVIAEGMKGSQVYEVVHIGEEALVGEIIGLEGDRAIIQAHEETLGLQVGEPIMGTGKILTAELGPGIVTSIYDGLQKSLTSLIANGELFLKRGAKATALPRDKKWHFTPKVSEGEVIEEGTIIGVVPETELVEHRIMVPPGISGKLKKIVAENTYSIEEPVAWIEQDGIEKEIFLKQEWPVRKPRPYKDRYDPSGLLVTGMRVIDYMFPLAMGGKAAIPGGFGTGKTVAMQQLVRWSQTDLNIYVGCGERGNEMADVLHSFTKLREPKTGCLLQEKEVFIANTSNMPVIAREVSIYIGITIAEYFRDMGYNVLMVADSSSRWAEAMRELGGRLEEMPGEEGFPPYLGSRLAAFYERAGMVECLGSPQRKGSLTVAGAVSPPGADFSEPVTQNTLRIVDALYALDASLANKRHFPTINWLTSYSLYAESIRSWWSEIDPNWAETRTLALKVLQQEAELEEIVRLVGPEALPENDKLLLLVARMIREDFLAQSAYHDIDTYTTPGRAHHMMKTITKFYELAQSMINSGIPVNEIRQSPMLYRISRMKDITNEEFDQKIKDLWGEMEASLVAR